MKIRLRHVLRERDTRGCLDEQVLSIYRDFGVVPKADRSDNFNKTPEDVSNYKLVMPGDVVVNKMKAWQGSVAISSYRGIISGDYLVCEVQRAVERRYLHHLLRSRPLIAEYEMRSKGIRPSQWRLYWDDLGDILVDLPDAHEQSAIAEFLDAETTRIEDLIGRKRALIALLQARTESALSSLLEPLVRQLGEVPLKAVADLRVSNVDKRSSEGEIPVRLCNYTDVYYNRRITAGMQFMEATAASDQVKRLALRAGDVLITKDSETAEDIAVPARVIENLPGVVLGYHLAMLRPAAINPSFLYWALRSRRCRDAFSLAASGITRFGLRTEAVRRVPIPNADANTQNQVVEQIERAVDAAERASACLARQMCLLQDRRQALITAAVKGEFDDIPGVAA